MNQIQSMKTYLLLFAFFATSLSFGQYTDVINSNRPGVSRSAFSVGTNVLQFEMGPYFVKEKHTPLQYEVSGFGADFMARYGLFFEQLEVSLEGTYQNDKFTDNRSAISSETKRSNFKNFTLGAKYLIYDPYKNQEDKPNVYSYHANRKFQWKSLIPAVSAFVGANFDSKDNPYTAPDVEGFSPKVMIATQNNFSNGWVLVLNLIKDRIGSDYSDFQYIITLTKSLNEQWVLFGETQGIKSDFYADNLFRFGGAYLWSKDFQLDTAITLNTKDTPSVFNVNLGASYRFDFHKDKEPDNNNSAKDEMKRKQRANKHKNKIDTDF
ncbi:transporter [Mangrovimonas sp. YM274]|uniref:transporter n=1 Tax=Mangrovimonas sp. YM274 TaxID=3070660 RepID=UPI0027DCB1FD|nr:transporter [Mangrovimonas sp. YM274]WMI67210.1 transporter [Mangrovimonas sp. YM274]